MDNKEKKAKKQVYLANVEINNHMYSNSLILIDEKCIKIDNSSSNLQKLITYQDLVFFAHNKENNMIIIQYNCYEGVQGDEGSQPFSTMKIFPEDKNKISKIFNKINKYNTLNPNIEFEGK